MLTEVKLDEEVSFPERNMVLKDLETYSWDDIC